jgi:hypothetical protein
MVHPVNSPLLIGAFVLALAFLFAIGLFLGNRRKRAAEFRNYFCSGFERDLFPSSSFGEDESFGGNNPKFAPIRVRSFSDNDRE